MSASLDRSAFIYPKAPSGAESIPQMQARIYNALQMSLNSNTIIQATQELEQLRILPDFTQQAIPLLTSQLSLPAMIYIALANRNFADRPPQQYVQVVNQLLYASGQVPASTIPKMSVFLSQLVAHLFQTGWFTSISELAERFVSYRNVIALDCIAYCFEQYKRVSLNDEIATKILSLLHESETAVYFALTNYNAQYSSLLTILEAAYTWEDLPDFYSNNYTVIIDLLAYIVQHANQESFHHIVYTVVEALSNHSTELAQHFDKSIYFLMYSLEIRLLDQNYEVVVAKLLTRLANFVASPELQRSMLTYSEQLSYLAFKGLEITEQDYEAVQHCDSMYLQCYQSRFDFNSRKEGSEQLLKELCQCCAGLSEQVQKVAFQLITPENICQQISLFRIVAVQSFSRLMGMRLNVDSQVVSQFAQALATRMPYIASVDTPQNALTCSTVLKFVADFYENITQVVAEKLILQLLQLYHASKNKFYNKNIAAVIVQRLSCSQPLSYFVDEKLLEKLLYESQQDVNSDLEISAVSYILRQVVCQLSQQAQEQFMQNLLALLQFAITSKATQSYLHYLFETIGCFIKNCKFDGTLIFKQFVQLSNQVGEEQLLEISPFIYYLFTLCTEIQLLLPVFYQTLTLENYQYYPDMIPAFLFFAESFLRAHTRYQGYQRPKQLLRLTDQFDNTSQNAISTIEMLIPQIIQMPTKASLGLKFLNNLKTIYGFKLEEEFLQQVAEYLSYNRQLIFLNRQYLKQASIFLLDNFYFVKDGMDVFSSIIKPAASTFGLRDVFKQRYCGTILQLVETRPELREIGISTLGIALGKIRVRGFYTTYNDEKDQTVNAISLLESCKDNYECISYTDLLNMCQQALGIQRWY